MKRGMKNVMTMVSKALGILLMIELYDKTVRKSRQKQLLYSQILHYSRENHSWTYTTVPEEIM